MESKAWKDLHAQGLASTPRVFGVKGCGLCYNCHGQWLGLYPDRATTGRTFRDGFRSERKALLQVLIALWRSHANAIGEIEVESTMVDGVPLLEYIELLSDEQAACLE